MKLREAFLCTFLVWMKGNVICPRNSIRSDRLTGLQSLVRPPAGFAETCLGSRVA